MRDEVSEGDGIEQQSRPHQTRSHEDEGCLGTQEAIWLGEQEDEGTEEDLGGRKWGR